MSTDYFLPLRTIVANANGHVFEVTTNPHPDYSNAFTALPVISPVIPEYICVDRSQLPQSVYLENHRNYLIHNKTGYYILKLDSIDKDGEILFTGGVKRHYVHVVK